MRVAFACAVAGVVAMAGTAQPQPQTQPQPWLSARGNLDGAKGDETVTLDRAGNLAVDGVVKRTIDVIAYDDAFDNQAVLQIVPLGRQRTGVLVAAPTGEAEDPPNQIRIYLYESDSFTQVYDETLGSYGPNHLQFDAKGRASYVEDDWTACLREQKAGTLKGNIARRMKVTLALTKDGTRFREVSRRPSGQRQDCSELSACPVVYEIAGGGMDLRGEILRDVRGAAAATTQSLPLSTGSGETTVMLTEEKLEVTFIDAVHVEVDGQVIQPRECIGNSTLPYCAADGTSHVMRFGDSLSLTFDAPAGARVLVAHGYYVPTPTRPFR
jgi:hypothetical protein